MKAHLLTSLLMAVSICASSQEAAKPTDCSTLRYLRHRVSCLCGTVDLCFGDICGIQLSRFDLDKDFDVMLRDKEGRRLESRRISSTDAPRNFCFEGQRDGDYQIAFVLYQKGAPQPAVVFPTNYKQGRKKACDSVYMVEPLCPK
jgi:hypothetical protein